ncbi:MAG: 3-hydroxyacyl-ACP dehydratase FabZ [Alphaproteobacteria bacterium]|nr:3-hydroxyacyl-ACP dehydratase FabZ [Alphaproteobacteria bacterium]
MSENVVYHIEDIMKFLPHRYPFLLVDRLEVEIPGEKGMGLKNLTMNEEFFQGHFPGNPVMPGVLQIEAMAQTAGAIVVANSGDDEKTPNVLFMSIDKVKFRKPVKPGDQLKMYVEKVQSRRNVFVFKGISKVDDKVVSEAEFTAMIMQ